MSLSSQATSLPDIKVLVFDSGVGGLSILEQIHQAAPACKLIFTSDNAAYPYGTKSETELIDRMHTVIKQLIATYAPDILVIACNSASTLVLSHLRKYFDLPIVGVVPAIKPAAESSESKIIGLLATPGTITRNYTHTLIKNFADDCEVILQGSSDLVDIAEDKLRGIAPEQRALEAIIRPFFETTGTSESTQKLDTIVLACTHFPLLKDDLKQVVPYPVQWIDSGEAIARRVRFLVHELDSSINLDRQHPYRNQAVFTRNDDDLKKLIPALQRFHIDKYELLEI